MLEEGHRRILPLALLGSRYPDIHRRFAGYRDALKKAEICADHDTFAASLALDPADPVAMRALLCEHGDATALVCMNEETTAHVTALAHEAGVSIPQDLSLVSTGSHRLDTLSPPRISTGARYDWSLTLETGLELMLKMAATRRSDVSTVLLKPQVCLGETLALPRTTGDLRW